MPKCKSCGSEILWISTSVGHMMPVDPGIIRIIPQIKASVTIVTAEGVVVKGNKIDLEECFLIPDTIVTGYISHFATCPNADQHRRK